MQEANLWQWYDAGRGWAMPPRYPHLPPALLRLLEVSPWEGTSTELYIALEPYRVEPWPANPVALSLWLKHHAKAHGIQVEAHHTGERRVLCLARVANGLKGATIPAHSGTIPPNTAAFWSFPTWGALLEGLPAVFDSHPSEITFTLAYRYPNWQSARAVTRFFLESEAVGVSLRFPQVLEVRIYPGEVDIATVWPMENRIEYAEL
jgi:hypothetical protein